MGTTWYQPRCPEDALASSSRAIGKMVPSVRRFLQRLRTSGLDRDRIATLTTAVTVLLFVGYIGFAEASKARRRPSRAAAPAPVFPVSIAGAELRGNPSARVVVILYSDFICGACGRFALNTYPALDEKYVRPGHVQLALRHMPAGKFRSLAPRAAEAASCAGDQGKFWEMYDAIFRAQLDREYGRAEVDTFNADLLGFATAMHMDVPRFEACLVSDAVSTRVSNDAGTGLMLGVDGTPAVLVGSRIGGRVKVTKFFDQGVGRTELFGEIDALLRSATTGQ